MKMRIRSELMQFETGMSINLYLPPSGTAGFALCPVRGYRRWPTPPPRMTDITSSAAIVAHLQTFFDYFLYSRPAKSIPAPCLLRKLPRVKVSLIDGPPPRVFP